ncbi:MAG: rRNA maturation RNase YbeY [Pseudomonadota bacterium]
MLVETIIEAPAWEDLDLASLAERAAVAVLAQFGQPPEGYLIALLGCNDARIAELNGDFRDRPTPTNVLSWPITELEMRLPPPGAPDDPEELGDIAIAYETCAAEAATAGISLSHHVTHLIVHAMLHLLGYDHQTDAEAQRMENLETAILVSMGHPDPY